MAVGINFALALVNVLTDFPVLLGAADKLAETAGAAVFLSGVELPLACGRLFSPHVRPKDDLVDPKDF